MTAPCGRAADGHPATSYKASVDEPEVRFRYGYKVIGCDPRLIGSAQDRDFAESGAMSKAADVSRKMVELAGPAEVEWWVQKVTITAKAVYDQPEGALLSEDEVAALISNQTR